MATSATPSASAIPYWGYYANNTLTEDPNQSATGQQFIRAVQQYDPSASFVQHASPYEDSGGPIWTLQYDSSKLPGGGFPNAVDLNANDYSPLYGASTGHGMQGTVNNASGVTHDATYGTTTPSSNFTVPSDHSLLDVLGPLAVLGFGFAAPALLGGFEAGAGAGAGAGALDTGGDSFLGLTDDGFPAFQGVPASGASAGDVFAGSALDPYPPLDTSSDSFLGLQNDGYPAFQGVPASGVSPNDAFAGSALASGAGSSLLGKIPQVINALSKVPGLGGGSTGGGGGAGGGGGGLLNVPPAQYGSLAAIVKKYYGGLLGQ